MKIGRIVGVATTVLSGLHGIQGGIPDPEACANRHCTAASARGVGLALLTAFLFGAIGG